MGGHSAPMPYQPANQAGADSAMYGNLQQNTANNQNLWATAWPQYNSAVSNISNNPGNATAMQGAWQTAGQGQQTGLDQIGRGNQMSGLTNGVIQSGFDPQSAMYNWNLGQTMNATQAGNAASGLAGSPFGAGVMGDTANKFNLDWQAGAQQRQGNAINQLGQISQTANADQGQGLKTLEASSLAPMTTYNEQQTATMSALNQLVQAMSSIGQGSAQNTAGYGAYLGLGQNATQIADQATAQNNQNTLGGAIGSLLGMGTAGGGTIGGDGMTKLMAMFGG